MTIPSSGPSTALRHGAYVCIRFSATTPSALAALPIPSLVERFAFRNEFDAETGHPDEAIAFLRRVDGTHSDIADETVRLADVVIHVASQTADPVAKLCAEVTRLLAPAATLRILSGVVRATNYTGGLMHGFAYAPQRQQQPGPVMPNAFLLPMRKTAAWWAKHWMERHTYFLPRYDETGRQISEGHALAAAPGIPYLMRRTYKHAVEPAPGDAYDFLTYFECDDAGVPAFHEVCVALRDVRRNPEWAFVREGPTWQGRRVAAWPQLFA